MGKNAFPTKTPYITMLSPTAKSFSAILCFAFTGVSVVISFPSKLRFSPCERSVKATLRYPKDLLLIIFSA